MGEGAEGRGGLNSYMFVLTWFETPPRRGGVEWKRTVLGRGGGTPASQYWTLCKNKKKTGTIKG